MYVQTHHQIIPVDNDRMELVCFECGPAPHQIVTATRQGDGWLITADGADNTEAVDRGAAIDAMIATALEILPDKGYSCSIPHGLRELP